MLWRSYFLGVASYWAMPCTGGGGAWPGRGQVAWGSHTGSPKGRAAWPWPGLAPPPPGHGNAQELATPSK